jgi:hypothetical protein
MTRETQLRSLYTAFNDRDVDTALAGMTEDVDWPNGWEGGRVVGRDAVRSYWLRQWEAVDSRVDPGEVRERPDGVVEVLVHQTGRDRDGALLFDQQVRHLYRFDGGLVARMDIEE